MKATIIFSVIIFSLIGCVKEPFELKYKSENSLPAVTIMSPCTYRDSIKVNGINGCYGKVDIELREHFDYEEARASWYTSAAVFVITHDDRNGFAEITENTEYDLSKFSPIEVSLIDYGFSGKNYKAINGKIYLTRTANGKLRADWCNLTLKDNNSSYLTSTFGGFEFP